MAIKTDSTFGSGLVSARPVEYNSLTFQGGHYKVNAITGATVSLTANDPILSFRWTSSGSNALIHKIRVNANVTSNITTTVGFDLEAIIARSFTASDSAGTAVTMGAFQKARTSMNGSIVGDFRVATTGKLTAGTRTLDTLGFAFLNVQMAPTVTNVGSCSLPLDLYAWDETTNHPLVLAANEGFIIRTPTAANTSGGVRYAFSIEWAEVPATTSTTVGF